MSAHCIVVQTLLLLRNSRGCGALTGALSGVAERRARVSASKVLRSVPAPASIDRTACIMMARGGGDGFGICSPPAALDYPGTTGEQKTARSSHPVFQ